MSDELDLDPAPARRPPRTPRYRPLGQMTYTGERTYVPYPLEEWDMEELRAVSDALLAAIADGVDPDDQLRRCIAASRRCGRPNPDAELISEIVGTVTGHCDWLRQGGGTCP